MTNRLSTAHLIALIVPAALLGGAYVSQYGFGLYPCEMCWWQRYPHFVAIALALIAYAVKGPGRVVLVRLAGIAIIVSGLIGAFHAGVEYGWWEGLTACTTVAASDAVDPLEAIMNAPTVRCDEVAWSLFGISLAGWNFLISVASGIAVLVLSARTGGSRVGKA
ncbi:disulfide bond formation protein B [Croceicoccus naphthovorans]|uniref:Disulfide bond formation protein n=1 Tax=Croceicoccus naphthovorans TaxID=1348774 RepID=A0A0G3XL97_9SPHN|nr:disulfide bond formation protein B [Croceicoccus naphthovorans]AKM11173.1 disulfide bond formation protein [Croceicoccus naphthovorans]MBB3989939.1 disulfide bond formation protein DsbB [Croceicoccus naphthovorans]